jgi:hypothetical protein
VKRFRRLLVLALLVGVAYAAFQIWQGPLYALVQIDRGIRERDPGRVERYADLEKLVLSSTVALAQIAKDQAGAPADVGGALLGALVGAVATEVGKAVATEATMAMRQSILDGSMQRGIGPFVVNQGISAFGDMQRFDTSFTVTLRGKCENVDATLKVVLEQRDAGYLLGLVKKSVLVGIDKDSAQALAATCAPRK